MLERGFLKLQDKNFDLLVIGGGIGGLSIAWDAVLRGLSVALVEKGDFGSGASQGCFKIVHGGLRYLQHADFARLRESVEEQRVLRIIAPHLIRPLPILVPCYGFGLQSPEVLRAGVGLYDLLTGGRNAGVSSSAVLPRGERLSRAACLDEAPYLQQTGLRGGVAFYDAQMTNCDRLTLSFALSAAKQGAVLCNYTEAAGFSLEAGRIRSVAVVDKLSGARAELRPQMVLNAAGTWSGALESLMLDRPPEPKLFSKGMQLVLPKTVSHYALALESRHADRTAYVARGGRSYFLVPWRDSTLLGTADIVHKDDPDACRFDEVEVKRFLSEARAMYPAPQIDHRFVRYVFGGLRPVAPEIQRRYEQGETISDSDVGTAKKDIISARRSIAENLMTVVGVKYTTCRSVAEQAVDEVCRQLGRSELPCRTRTQVLCGAGVGDREEFVASLLAQYSDRYSPAVLRELAENYGTLSTDILDISAQLPETERLLGRHCRVLAAEVLHAVRFEAARMLSDIVFRRTALGTTGSPGKEVLERAAAIAAAELGWDGEETALQLAQVWKRFPVSADAGAGTCANP